MQSGCVVWTVIFSGLLITLHVSVAENQGTDNVGGRKIGHRAQMRAQLKTGPSKKINTPPIGSDSKDSENVNGQEAKQPPNLSEEDKKLKELSQKVGDQAQEKTDPDNVATNIKDENVPVKDSEVKLTESTEQNDNKATENIEKDSNGAKTNGEKVEDGGQVKEVTGGQTETPEHSKKDGEACVDCEAGKENENVPEVKKEPEPEATEQVPSPEKPAEDADKVQKEVVAKEGDVIAKEQDSQPQPPQEGDTQGSEKEPQQGEELSTVKLPPVENKVGVEIPEQQADTQETADSDTDAPPPPEPDTENKEGDITAPTQDSDMPSFDEWKKRMLAEQAQQQKSKQLEAQIVHTSSGSSTKKPGKGRNYASLNCGAKVLATNPEAQNTGSVLSENRDSYIIQPCKAKKWFVIELCEPVQVRSLEIANLELFSSLPEKFVVNISDRYPTKEWKAIGTFHARDARAIQSFSVENVDIYAKYLRIEMLSHYGREHYCPLTILRVFGTTVEEDDDTDHADHDQHVEDAGEGEENVQDEPSNLFSTATGTVLSLVKTVLSPSEKGTKEEMQGVAVLNGTATNQSVANVTKPAVEDDKKEPCAPSPRMDDHEKPEKEDKVEPQQFSRPEAPDPAMFINNNAPADSGNAGQAREDSTVSPTAETQEGPEEVPETERRIVTLIERPISLNTVLSKCHYCEKPGGANECYFDTSSVCGYYKFLRYVYPTCCFQKGKIIQVQQPINGSNKLKKQQQGSQEEKDSQADVPPASGTDIGGQATVEESLKPSRVTSTYEPQSSKVTDTLNLTGIADVSSVAEGIEPSETVKMGATSVEMTATASATDSATACDSKGEATDAACNTMGPGVLQIRPTAALDESSSVTPTPTSSTPHSSVDSNAPQGQDVEGGQGQNGGQEKVKPTPEETKPPPPEPTEKVIHAEETVENEEYEAAPMQDADMELVKYSSEKKQTTFMKLKNRIKMLELNLNLSSRYLEELSQRYKRQMEEMYISLNRTITKLTNTSKSAEARDLKQQEHIFLLQKRIANLTNQLTSLSVSFANIHSEVIERHLFLMLIELAVFCLLFLWCIHRNTRTVDTRTRKVEVLATKEENRVEKVTPKKQILKRRNSVGASPSEKVKDKEEENERRSVDDIAIRRTGSVGSFGIIDPSTNVFINQNPDQRESDWKDQVPKRKRKKHKGKSALGIYPNSSSSDLCVKQSSQPSSSGGSQDGDFTEERRSSSFTSWAGVLFGKTREPPGENVAKQELCRSNSNDVSKLEKHKDKRKPFKGRRSLDLHLHQANGSVAHSEAKINGHKSHINGDLNSVSNNSGYGPKNNVVNVGRTDLVNGHEMKKSSQMNGSPNYYKKEGAWKSHLS